MSAATCGIDQAKTPDVAEPVIGRAFARPVGSPGLLPKQRPADLLKVWMVFHQFLDPAGKACPGRLADLQPKAAQDPPQAVLDVQRLVLDQLPCGQRRADRGCA